MALQFKDRSYREIVEVVGCSHRNVSTARKAIMDGRVTAQQLADLSDAQLQELFPDEPGKVSAGYDLPDFARVVTSMRSNPHLTLLQAWRGYVGSGTELRRYAYSPYPLPGGVRRRQTPPGTGHLVGRPVKSAGVVYEVDPSIGRVG